MNFPELYRWNNVPPQYRTVAGDTHGMFLIPGRDAKGRILKVMASSGSDEIPWEHVSVSLADQQTKCPSWDEMCIVKDLFWDAEELVVQYHPPKSQYVNHHSACLHMWRHKTQEIPIPETYLVGPR